MEIVTRASRFLQNTAVYCRNREFTYSDLLYHSNDIKEKLLQGRKDLEGERVAFLSPQAYEFLPMQWGIWQAGGIAVPLCLQHPPPEWEYILNDSAPIAIVCHSDFLSELGPLAKRKNIRLIPYNDFSHSIENRLTEMPIIDENRGAQIIYTSGTTGRPKGAVLSHRAIHAQLKSLSKAWEWSDKDHVLEVLPLNHLHGNIVVASCALYSGAKITIHPKFDEEEVWKLFKTSRDLNVFMGVPTMYSKLIQVYKQMNTKGQYDASRGCRKFRLMVSGSMALPEFTMNEWQNISSTAILERYGMTECGMILSNPYKGERKHGYVGKVLPGIETKIVDTELRVKTQGMFTEYFRKPQETKAAYDEQGWFKTGDIAKKDEKGNYRIIGRANVDIIKSRGFKISALDVENDLLGHPDIKDVSIVGIPNDDYGQIIGAVFVAKQKLSLEEIQNWSRSKIAAYKVPRAVLQIDSMPRNQMGKVNKVELVKLFGN